MEEYILSNYINKINHSKAYLYAPCQLDRGQFKKLTGIF